MNGRQDAGHQPDTPWLDQGSVFRSITRLPVMTAAERLDTIEAPLGIAVVSQTCDNVRAQWVQVVPIVSLSGNLLADAAKGRTPKYAPLPGAAPNHFAALETVTTISKAMLREHGRSPGVVALRDARRFAQAVGRRFARFAFPDELVAWFEPLRKVAQKKAGSADSPEGQALARISQIRVRSENGWDSQPFVLGVTVVLDEGELTLAADFEGSNDDELREWVSGRGAADIATRLAQNHAAEQAFLFLALGEAWLAKCAEGHASVVRDYSVEVASADEYSMAEYYKSEALDFDHLSDPPLSEEASIDP